MASPAWLATATGWVPALYLPDFSGAAVKMLATFIVTGEVAFGGKDDFREFSELISTLHLLFQVSFAQACNGDDQVRQHSTLWFNRRKIHAQNLISIFSSFFIY
jgi:hypothetical protein